MSSTKEGRIATWLSYGMAALIAAFLVAYALESPRESAPGSGVQVPGTDAGPTATATVAPGDLFSLGRPPTGPVNVLLITLDTVRGDAWSGVGGRAKTPTLDGLGARGTVFTNAHAHNVVTLPSHTNIMTGTYAPDHGVHDNSGFRVPERMETIAEVLARHSYETAAFVAALPVDARFGLNQGFGLYDDDYPTLPEGHRPNDFTLAERKAPEVIGRATRWLEHRSASSPWFAWVHLFDAHSPYEPPEPFASTYADAPYYGEVAFVDESLAPLIELVEKHFPRTLIVVTSDHGESLGEHGEATHGMFAYESTLHVLLIIAGPGVERGRRTPLQVSHVDLFPTILDAAGIDERPSGLRGQSLYHFDRSRASSYFEAFSVALNANWAPLRGLIEDNHKAIDLPIPELYDLASDPREEHNLYGDQQARYERMMDHLFSQVGELVLPLKKSEDPQLVKQLAALGYMSGGGTTKTTFTEADDPKQLIHLHKAYQKGIELYQQGDKQGAIETYRKILAERPDMLTAALNLSFVLRETGDLEGAIETLQEAVATGGARSTTYSFLATFLVEAGRADEAVQLMQALVTPDSEDVDALNAYGVALGTAGRPQEAIPLFRRILEIDPRDAAALQNLGTVYLKMGDLVRARSYFEEALEIDGRLAKALNGLGVVEVSEGHPDKAVALWKRCVEVDPTQFDTLFNLGVLLDRLGRRGEAEIYWRRFAETAPASRYGEDLQRARARLSS